MGVAAHVVWNLTAFGVWLYAVVNVVRTSTTSFSSPRAKTIWCVVTVILGIVPYGFYIPIGPVAWLTAGRSMIADRAGR